MATHTISRLNPARERRAEADRLLDIIGPVCYLFAPHAERFIKQVSSCRCSISPKQLAWLQRLTNEFYAM